MKRRSSKLVRFLCLLCLALWAARQRAVAQVVEIPDAGLRDAIRAALGKPTGDITVADMESLVLLDASRIGRGDDAPLIGSLEGLQVARNLWHLDLSGAPGYMERPTPANLETGDLSPLGGLTNLTVLQVSCNQLTTLTLPAGLASLTALDLSYNQLTSLTLPAGLSRLSQLTVNRNPLTQIILPDDMTSLTLLDLEDSGLTTFSFLHAPGSLTTLYLQGNQLTNLSLPAGLTNLTALNLDGNQLTNLTLPAGLTSLNWLYLSGNRLTDFSFLSGLTSLTALDLSSNQLTSLTLPAGLTSLTMLYLQGNQLTSLTLPADLTWLWLLDLRGNRLTDFSFLSGLTRLSTLYLNDNRLTGLTLPTGLAHLSYLGLSGNPLATLVLPEPMVAAVLPPIGDLTNQGVAVYFYPLEARLVAGQPTAAGTFGFTLTGPPGSCRVQVTSDFSTWTDLDSVTNTNGTAAFTDSLAGQRPRAFYRVKVVP
jgi:Leucine-rich repeat (LRR) protein